MQKKVSIIDYALRYNKSIFLDSVSEVIIEEDTIRNKLLVYQNIIAIWFNLKLQGDNKNRFSITDIGNYLLRHHRPFIDEFAGSRMTFSNRLESKRSYIEKRVDDLKRLNILQFVKEIESLKKNKTKTHTYSFLTIL